MRKLKIRMRITQILLLFTVVTIGLLLFEGYNLRRVYNQGRESQELLKTQYLNTPEVQKVKTYYMLTNEKLWGELAEYLAVATVKASIKHKVDLKLLVGVIEKESEAYPFAVSSTGAAGMGQVDFKAHADRFPQIASKRDKFDPMKNIDCTAELLAESISKHGLRNGLHVYNVGSGAFARGERNLKYVKAVLNNAKKFRES